MREQYFHEFYREWMAENGLPFHSIEEKLRATTEPRPLDGFGQGRNLNQNGILFLAYMLMASRVAGLDVLVKDKLFKTSDVIERLTRKPFRGLYDRWPVGDAADKVPHLRSDHERHDNYAAIASLSALFGLKFVDEILAYGQKTLWHYDNVNPKREWFNSASWRQQRQLGEVAFYYLCAGQVPGPIKTLWMLIGLLLNAYKPLDNGETLLAWLRLYTLHKVAKGKGISLWFPLIWTVGWIWKRKKDALYWGIGDPISRYFIGDHPLGKLAKTLGPGNWGF